LVKNLKDKDLKTWFFWSDLEIFVPF
jgi:hypothetical protein